MLLKNQKAFSFLLLFCASFTSLNAEQQIDEIARPLFRSRRSISGLWRRLMGRKQTIRTGFQGTAIANNPYSSQPSSFFSQYLPSNPFSNSRGNSYPANGGGYGNAYSAENSGLTGFGSNVWTPQGSSYTNVVDMGSSPQAASSYATYTPPENPNNVDFHAVLDQFVRSAGLSPHGDHDTAASSIQAKGDTPVFSFKKLYSFPFYLSTDDRPTDGVNVQIPYMKKHIRRMFQEGSFKNPKFFADKQAIQNWLHPKSWHFGSSMGHRSPLANVPLVGSMTQNGGQWLSPSSGESNHHFVSKMNQHQAHHPVAHHQRRQQYPKQIFAAAPPSSRPASLPITSQSSTSSVGQVHHQVKPQHLDSAANPVQPVIRGDQSGQASQAYSSGTSSPSVSVINSQALFTQYLQDQLTNANSDRSQLSQLSPTKEEQTVYNGQHTGFKSAEKTSGQESRYHPTFYFQQSPIKQATGGNAGHSEDGHSVSVHNQSSPPASSSSVAVSSSSASANSDSYQAYNGGDHSGSASSSV